MAYTDWEVVAFEQPTAAKWNQLGENDAGFKDGTNFDDGIILERHIGDGEVTAPKRSEVIKVGAFTLPGSSGSFAVTGVGFRPKAVIFFGAMDSSHQSAAVANFQIGFSDGTTTRAFGMRAQESSDISAVVSTSNVLWIPGTGQGVATPTTLTSLDSDGFTLNVGGTNATSVAYIAIA